MTQPMKAAADASTVDSLLSSIIDLNTRSTIDPSGRNASVTGLDQPNFKIELTTKAGKTINLAIGNKSATGGNAYVRVNDEKQAALVPADFYDQLDKPASSFRDLKLVDAKTTEISEVQIHSPKGDLQLTKSAPEAWEIHSGPTTMPADQTAVSDVLFALSGMRATEFTTDELTDATAPKYQLDNPVATVSFTSSPATQPASSQPSTQRTTTTVKFGRFEDIQKRNLFVATSASNAIAKVPASTLETFEKKPLDLREKKVVNIDPQQVESIQIAIDKPSTTQPTTKPAEQRAVMLTRRPPAPATKPAAATQAASTQPTTLASSQPSTAPSSQPVAATQPASKWELATGPGLKIPADDSKIEQLLTLLNPLQAEKFLEAPATQPSAVDHYTLTIVTGPNAPVTYQLTLTDRGNSVPAEADYNGLIFETPRTIIERLSEKFEASPTPKKPDETTSAR
jgi:hypothetical protein